nr:MAG TPA: hypothetical protein [Caudoviricetes sp.]
MVLKTKDYIIAIIVCLLLGLIMNTIFGNCGKYPYYRKCDRIIFHIFK